MVMTFRAFEYVSEMRNVVFEAYVLLYLMQSASRAVSV